MANEIERINVNEDNQTYRAPIDAFTVLRGVATMQLFTIGMLFALNVKLRNVNVKEVVVVVKEAKGE
jgi:hypothetical protein